MVTDKWAIRGGRQFPFAYTERTQRVSISGQKANEEKRRRRGSVSHQCHIKIQCVVDLWSVGEQQQACRAGSSKPRTVSVFL